MTKKELAVTIMNQMVWDENGYFINMLNKTYLPLTFDSSYDWYDKVDSWCKKVLGLDDTDYYLAKWWWGDDFNSSYSSQMADKDLSDFRKYDADNALVWTLSADELMARHHKLYHIWYNALPY